MEAQFAGKTFPEDGSGSVDVTVKRASVAASGDRLLISLLVNAKEKKSFLGFGGEATVHIWGRPALDPAQQTLRLTDIELAVESEAAFGLLGAAARAAMPHLQKALAEKAVVDLKPFASNAQKKIAAVIADFQKNEDGVRVAAEITSLRLADIAFDSKTLRVIAEADGAIKCLGDGAAGAVTYLPLSPLAGRGGKDPEPRFDRIETGLWIPDLTRFLDANRFPPRIKSGAGFRLKTI